MLTSKPLNNFAISFTVQNIKNINENVLFFNTQCEAFFGKTLFSHVHNVVKLSLVKINNFLHVHNVVKLSLVKVNNLCFLLEKVEIQSFPVMLN